VKNSPYKSVLQD